MDYVKMLKSQSVEIRGKQWTCAAEFGWFTGSVKTLWLDDGRNMQLLEDFLFTDRNGTEWPAYRYNIINGSNIPAEVWTISNMSPFVGPLRIASVPHDPACVARNRDSVRVHQMFHDACRASGASAELASIVGRLVSAHGPRWKVGECEIINISDQDAYLRGAFELGRL